MRVDQPFFVCRVDPSPAWPSVKPYFDELATVPLPDSDGLRTAQALKRILDLQLALEDVESGTFVERYYLSIHGDEATLRISGT
ncbi:hypothetical protein ACWC24_34960 [Streptomyces sp. NPDC001443]